MASSESYEDIEDGYSDEEDEWEDAAVDGSEVASWCKDHHEASAHLSELVSVAEFQRQCSKVLTTACGRPAQANARSPSIALELGIAESELSELQDQCNPQKLLPPNGHADLRKLDLGRVKTESVFSSLKNPKNVRNLFSKSSSLYGYDYREAESAGECADLVPSGEVVLTVVVFHPITKKRDREYSVLGSQKLTKLRDIIYCQNDYLVQRDFSENPSSCKEFMETLPYPPNRSSSAFFFINNCFYNDMRHAESFDLSKSIIEWSSVSERLEKSRRLEQFRAADMDGTSFLQLSVRLGYPYLFTHHMDCEHLMMFTDMRMFHPGVDKRSASAYPRITCRHFRIVNKCQVCKSAPSWVTVNDELAISSPCHFCEDCFIKLHYNKEGKKIANFEAYPFHPSSH